MKKYSKFVGLDVHKADISVGMANADRAEAVYYGRIENEAHSYLKVAKKLSKGAEEVLFCYEAGPCGYEVYRQLSKAGYDCVVIAPSLIPRKAGDRVKRDLGRGQVPVMIEDCTTIEDRISSSSLSYYKQRQRPKEDIQRRYGQGQFS